MFEFAAERGFRMRRLLGVEVTSNTLGCLQDVHWGRGAFGYFPSYALGCLLAAQLYEALRPAGSCAITMKSVLKSLRIPIPPGPTRVPPAPR